MTATYPPDIAVIVVAAGSGVRLGHAEPKAFVPLAGRTMLEHALLSVFGMSRPAQVIVVAPGAKLSEAEAIAHRVAGQAADALDIVQGGASRQESVSRGLEVLRPGIRTVLVHDAARALTPPALFDAVAAAVVATGHGVVPGLAVVDTIKRIDDDSAILETVDRSELAAVQTPQGFPRDLLVDATATASAEATDDAAIVAAAGHRVDVIPGSDLAFKITTRWDLRRAELLLGTVPAPRVGTGIDVHAFEPESDDSESGEPGLWLAGLFWPGERALSGHSDGDVVSHAVCDAMLAACGLGDVGSVFGTDDARFADAHGDVFLRETLARVAAAGYRVSNVSVQVIGNRPKVGPRRAEAEDLLGSILGAPVSVSATTTDALGFTGRGEGIAALASAIVVPLTPAMPDLSLGL